MLLRAALMALHILTVLFFIGIIGCAITILLSWISIFKSEFSKDQEQA